MSLAPLMKTLRLLQLFRNTNGICQCYFSAKLPTTKIIKEVDPDTGEIRSKKTDIVPRITLLSGGQISVTTLAEAEKLSRRRDLKLVKILDLDTKTQRPVYKLMSGSEFHAEDLKQREVKKLTKKGLKGEKIMLINSRISQHDLDTQLRRADRWVDKMYEVKVIISGAGGDIVASEKVFNSMEKHFSTEKSSRLIQKRIKGSDIRCQIVPVVPQSADL